MKLFKKSNTQDLTPVCKICGMAFTEVERMMRHMVKAHSKPCKGGSCGCG